ncbi:MAG: hypothetical protein GEU92_18065, partial [Alphaproteobacteria bacterium]|nr:hypothetical protein [Alphaproteobacteria bacterium]
MCPASVIVASSRRRAFALAGFAAFIPVSSLAALYPETGGAVGKCRLPRGRRCGTIRRKILSIKQNARNGFGGLMFSKLNHLAITTDNYTVLGMFYRAYFGMTVSGVTDREQSAISVGDGYVGMTLIPRRAGRRAGIDHFGIEVEDFDLACARIAEKYPEIEVVKRPSNRPFASFSTHDPAGNYFDLSQIGHENRAEVYDMQEWKQETGIESFGIRVREPGRVAQFYSDVFELEPRNDPGQDDAYRFTDGRVTMTILPWKISDFN